MIIKSYNNKFIVSNSIVLQQILTELNIGSFCWYAGFSKTRTFGRKKIIDINNRDNSNKKIINTNNNIKNNNVFINDKPPSYSQRW